MRQRRRPEQRGETPVLLGLAAAFLLFIVVGVAGFLSFERYNRSVEWVRHTHEVLERIEALVGALRDVEIGQRGYLLTGDPVFLEPYEEMLPAVPARLDQLRRLTRDNPRQQQNIDQLERLIEEKLAFVERSLEHPSPQNGAALVAEGRGKALMDDIRQVAATMRAEEERLLEQRSERAERAAWRTTMLIVIADATAFAGVSLAVLLLLRGAARRRRREAESWLVRERGKLESREALERGRLPSLLEELPVALALFEAREGRTLAINRRFSTLFPDAPRRLATLSDLAGLGLVGEDSAPLSVEAVSALASASASAEGACVRRVYRALESGQRGPVVLRVATVMAGGEAEPLPLTIVSLEDLSDTAAAEEERAAHERFRELFISLVGHDMRNPISVVRTGSEALLRRPLEPPEKKIVERVLASAARLQRMTDQMIALVEVRLAGGLQLHRTPTDLGEICRAVVDEMAVERPEREVTLTREGELTGAWDERRLHALLAELVRNADRHAPSAESLHVAAREVDGRVAVEVTGGAEIPEDVRPLVFDPFRRAERAVRLRSAGFGLGLYLAQQVALAHGGTLSLSTEPAGAPRLSLTLPRGGA